MTLVHYVGGDFDAKELYCENWRCDWKPCEHLLALGEYNEFREADLRLEVWGINPNRQNIYTRVICERCAKSRGYTW